MVKVPQGGHFAKSVKVKPKVSVMVKVPKAVPETERKIKTPQDKLPVSNSEGNASLKTPQVKGRSLDFDINKYLPLIERHNSLDRRFCIEALDDLKDKAILPSTYLLDAYNKILDAQLNLIDLPMYHFYDLKKHCKAWFFTEYSWKYFFYRFTELEGDVRRNLASINRIDEDVNRLHRRWEDIHILYSIILSVEHGGRFYETLVSDRNTLVLYKVQFLDLKTRVETETTNLLSLDRIVRAIRLLLKSLIKEETKDNKQKLLALVSTVK